MNYYHLAIATVLPTEHNSNWKNSSPPKPKVPRPSPLLSQTGEMVYDSVRTLWSRAGDSLGPVGSSVLLPTQRTKEAARHITHPQLLWMGPGGWVRSRSWREKVLVFTCSQVSTMYFPHPYSPPQTHTLEGPDHGTSWGMLWATLPLSPPTPRRGLCPAHPSEGLRGALGGGHGQG